MAARSQVFIGRLSRDTQTKELENIFSKYGKLTRCDIKYGSYGLAYAFVDFEDVRDAEDAVRYEDGREVNGSRMVVEWARGPNPDRGPNRGGGDRDRGPPGGMRGGGGGYGGGGGRRDDYYRDPSGILCDYCGRTGHMYRDCARYNNRRRSRSRSRSPRQRQRSRSRSLPVRRSRSRSSDSPDSKRKSSRSSSRSKSPR